MSGVVSEGSDLLLISEIPALRAWRRAERAAGRRVALVPTMGALHEGHLALVDEARRRADRVVLSVFVNPLQFGPNEDFQRYPRDLERDRALAAARGVDLLFAPTAETMYPPGAETRVVPGPAARRWEGEARPGHFAGVLTVVLKLFHLVEPDVAIFGQKDIQQATLIRRMVADLDLDLEFVLVPTVRESDGVALSSRNAYLGADDRIAARALSRGLRAADQAWRGGIRDAATLRDIIAGELRVSPGVVPDYIAVVDPETLEPVPTATTGTIVAVAARVGPTRLLDNHILGMDFR
jgi:pantoate--beta-alanine ligase